MQNRIPVLEAKELGVGYVGASGRRVAVVEDVNFALYPGEMTALVGESGCGKSITASALGNLLPLGMKMDAGKIRLDGHELANTERARLCGRTLAYIFQDPGECLNPVFTIENQLREALPPEFRNRASGHVRLLELLQKTGFSEPERVLRSYPHQLSGGMQQRAAIAMALAGNPRILVADEPTTALDVTVQAQVLNLLREIMKSEQLAVLLITHNLGIVAEYADWLHVMYAGRLVEQGPVTLLQSPAHPYVKGLLQALPRLDAATPPQGIPGRVPALEERISTCRFRPRCPEALTKCATWKPVPMSFSIPWKNEKKSFHSVECCRAMEAHPS